MHSVPSLCPNLGLPTARNKTNFQRDFVETEGFRRIADASELEQQEIRHLRTEGFLVADASPTLDSPPTVSSATPPRGRMLSSFKRFSLVMGRLLPSSSPLSSSAVGNPAVCPSTPPPVDGGDAA